MYTRERHAREDTKCKSDTAQLCSLPTVEKATRDRKNMSERQLQTATRVVMGSITYMQENEPRGYNGRKEREVYLRREKQKSP